MTAGSYGNMRATEADREAARTQLTDAHAEGRLTWEEFDARISAVLSSQTYGQLAELTADLPAKVPGQAMSRFPGIPAQQRTNKFAIVSLVCGVCGFVPVFGSLAAVILGHLARGQMRHTGEEGQAMAIIGLVFGYLGLAGWILVLTTLGLAFGWI